MKKFVFKTTLTLEVPSIVVASNEVEARERLQTILSHSIENEVKETDIKDVNEITTLKTVVELPSHFSSDHNTLLEMGYPIRIVKRYSQEDAEEEISAALSSI
ncbi:hypothetical protein [Psychrobacillus sp. FJAT-21963]|uniref:hypothetical protein n=1 Tax=Psychrobacillus sp. FJAT-21963 TaxID=1712028 RepID=UPI0006F9FF4A|nr:hypothetical protein [Psychrobacillus sp. FJAT-21963]KQL37158.1 hypothetical protein AN959_03735 [Psychrobacillus sp. FJAT-21963]